MRVHIIEDDNDIASLLEFNLAAEGYHVTSSRDGKVGLQAVKRDRHDFVLLDLMLPGLDGLEVCRQLKAAHETASIPIIIISVRGRESDVVLGLGLGADDYVTKPFSVVELLARVRAVRRRADGVESRAERPFEVHGLKINADKHLAWLNDLPLQLTATEFRLLHLLASEPGRLFSREALRNIAIGDDVLVQDHNIDVHIAAIRKKLGDSRDLIETVWGVGYRFKDAQ